MFMKGITNGCRRMINASVGGNYPNKTTTKVKTIIEDMAASERIVETNRSNLPKGMYELNAQDNLLALQQKMQQVKDIEERMNLHENRSCNHRCS